MFRRSSVRRSAPAGQALVELAVVLPVLVLLLVMAVDFGRVFFGWVALQNAARIGADRASQTDSAWPDGSGTEETKWLAQYQSFITDDLVAANCDFPLPHPSPTFTDVDGNGDAHDNGDLATVRLTCQFGLLTPLAQNVLGGPVQLAAESSFAINRAAVLGVPDAPPPACQAPVADFTTNPPATAAGGSRLDGVDPAGPAGFVVDFTDTSSVAESCQSVTYTWNFGDGAPTNDAMTPDVEDYEFFHTGGGHTNYNVVLTVTNEFGSDNETLTVRVRQP